MPSLRVPYSWLREYVQAPATVDEIAARLHMAGMEVDRVERVGGAWGDKVRVARIQKLEKHPNADKLQLATVEFGAAQPKTVVTGATNIAAGDVVPYGELGAEYVDGHTGERVVMKPKNMRGITSEGMILSAKELGLGEDHDGIMQLAKSLTVGVLLQDAIGDAVIVMEIAPNRPDALSILGIAREVAALYNVKLTEPRAAELPGKLDPSLLTIRIEDDRACPRFAAAYLEGIRIGPSPDWMQRRLVAAGMRPITNIVDITNYVMLEIGQPLHAYDATMLRGRVLVARKAKRGERLRTLDSKDRALRPEDLVIADGERALGLAGVMGGEDSEIRPNTTTVALEAASFEPLGIRRSSDAHGLQGSSGSAAARRFGLDLSPALVSLALARAVSLMGEHAGGRLIGSTDVYPHPRDRAHVRLRGSDVPRVLGASIASAESADALRRLGFDVQVADDTIDTYAPAFRTDIGIAEDIVEEVARIVGYDRIPTRLPFGPLPAHERHPLDVFRERVRDVLVGFGLQDTISYAAIDPAWLTKLTADGSPLAPEPLRITNPTTVSQSVMRPTLRASLLDTASRNLRHREGVGFFEISPVYLPRKAELPEERWTVGILLAGQAEPVHEGETWLTSPRSWDLHDLRGITIGLRDAVGAGPVKGALQRGGPGLHPGRSLRIESDGRVVAVGGQLDPRVAAMWELPEHATFVAEFELAHLLSETPAHPSAVMPSRYPAAIREIAIVVDEARPYGEVEQAITEAAKGVAESVALRDLYRGPQVGAGKKSFAVRVVLRSATGTLSEEDVEKALKRIQGRLERGLGASLRS
ncbi:MAG: phenylalanine--tRNA ligase subunit beta [Chloroflexi bacterium]|nr:MAG: phenylalanine--tRNA ligase subunit beta [Chloroflexota bacterium]TME43902.1 MAG: phenylalanine--tRNA ligase subunit beta [Chloroflexota bacterium]